MSDFEGWNKDMLVNKCQWHGLILAGNKDVLKERLRRHLAGEGSEFSKRGVPKREREDPVVFVDAPKHIWYEPSIKEPVLGIPVDVWQKIFSFTRYRFDPYKDFCYKDLLNIRMTCKYFHRPATVLLLKMSKECIGTEDILLFGFMNKYWDEYSSLKSYFGSDLFHGVQHEDCRALVSKFKNFASVKAKYLYERQKAQETETKRAKTRSVKKERALELNNQLDELGLKRISFSRGHWATPTWFQNLASRLVPSELMFAHTFLYDDLSKYLRTGDKTKGLVPLFFKNLTPEFVQEAKENNWL